MEDYEKFVLGEYTGWSLDRDGRLAIVILLDQFSKSLFLNQPKPFQADYSALYIFTS